MEELHISVGSHLGFLRTWYLLKSKYYWKGMYKMLFKFVQACNVCQFSNSRCAKMPGPMQLVEPPLKPFERIGIDFVGPFPTTYAHNNKYILVIIDHLTRYVEAKACKAADAKSAISALKECVIFRHSCPSEILCDNGSSFRSSEFAEFCKKYGMKILFTTSYHPNTNGICERVNGTIKRTIGKMVNEKHNDWNKYLSKSIFSINITMHKVTKFSPFYLLHGREPNLKCDVKLGLIETYVDERESDFVRKRVDSGNRIARKRTIDHQVENKEIFDAHHTIKTYAVGEKVLVANFVRKKGRVTKFLCKWKGPFSVVKQLGPINYMLKDERVKASSFGQIKNVSVRHLKPYYIYDFESEIETNVESEVSEIESYFSFRGNKTSHSRNEIIQDLTPPVSQNINADSNSGNEQVEVETLHSNDSDSSENVSLRRSTRSRAPPLRYGVSFTH